MKLARAPKYIGSDKLGMTAVLHTWGRDLNYHPHLHFIVPVVRSASQDSSALKPRGFPGAGAALSKLFSC